MDSEDDYCTMDEDDHDFIHSDTDDENDLMFSPIQNDKDLKKSYHVDFKPYTINDIKQFQSIEINHVSGILGCLNETAATLLRYFKWNKEKLIESYMENPEKVTADAGVIISAVDKPIICPIKDFCCEICLNDEEGLLTMALSCKHRFCVDCYRFYLQQKITEEGESRHISCPGSCPLKVDEKTVQSIVSPEVFAKYETLLLRTYVDDRKSLKWCPAPNCENAVECNLNHVDVDQIIPIVKCSSGHLFCFYCGLNDHEPITCAVVKLWLKKCADDSETSNWIAANTKECTKCNSIIEKNGGCNHMTCRKCKHEYYNRYANHEQSAKLDKELYERTEKKMEEMQQSSEFSWIQVQFLKSAVDVLMESRQTLMWTYALAFYLSRQSLATALFEDNQRDLEMAVENLSGMLETEITAENASELRKNVLDKTEYVNRRRLVVLSDTALGHLEKRWEYNFDTSGN
ncbi:hypothetical protein HDV02_005107 [Globomyces sp. JEL0801]|nr:hypothetical protein HDV02_005107 [Globomyces sp. JEL0801]